ncbi:MAG: hypothetical protein AAGE94_00325 [Acidobacteriota bacterium]
MRTHGTRTVTFVAPTRLLQIAAVALLAAGAMVSPASAAPAVSDEDGVSTPRQLPPPIVPPKTPPPDDEPSVRKGDDPPDNRLRYGYRRSDRMRSETRPGRRGAQHWQRRLDEIDVLLQGESWRNARRKAEALFLEMVDRDSTSRRALREPLGRVMLQMAIADAQQGLWKRAGWHWSTALMIDSSIAGRDLRAFADAGRWLSSLGGPRRAGEVPEGVRAVRRPWPDDLDPARLAPRDKLPELLVEHPEWREHPVHTIEIVVDRFGQLSHPVVLDADRAHPAYIAVLLGAIWQRRPAQAATRDGRRVTVVQEFLVEELFPGLAQRGRW